MYIDYKTMIWRRVHFNNEDSLKEIKKILEEGSFDVFKEELGFNYDETLHDTEEMLSLEKNDNQATIELFIDNIPDSIWNNEKKYR